jgi:AGZA family xanthine/uracil permease-like MFS transporter
VSFDDHPRFGAHTNVLDNIAYGIIAGIILFILIHNVPMLLGKISPRLLPPGWHDLKEPYDVAAMVRLQDTHGRSRAFAILPPWLRKALTGNKRFWAYTPEEIERHLEGRRMTARAGIAAADLRQAERDELRKALGHTTPRQMSVSEYDLERNGPSDPIETESNASKERKEARGPMMNPNSFK